MSVWLNIFHWAQNSGVLAQAQQVAAAESAKAIQAALDKAVGHAPDMKTQLELSAAQMLQATLAGLATKAK